MTLTDEELAALTLPELEDLKVRVQQAHARAWEAAHAAQVIDQAVTAFHASQGTEPGQEWVAPSGAHDAFPAGWTVTVDGEEWESLVPANVWRPGDPADPQAARWWRKKTPPAEPADDAWVAGRAYKVGDQVTHGGVRYVVLQAHTSQSDWAPPAVPALYRAMGVPNGAGR